jgi:hypothetical protein
MGGVVKPARWHSCNVLHAGAFGRQLWHFTARDRDVSLAAQDHRLPSESLPPKMVGRSWSSLWQRKLNLAWLPPDQVFLKVLELPPVDPAEVPGMVELQLEKISPVPVTQLVWSCELLTASRGESEPTVVIVAIAARSAVEEFLGRLEAAGFEADCLDLSFLAQLEASRPEGDGTCLYPVQIESRTVCLAAWWYGGRLRHLELYHLGNEATDTAELCANLEKTSWAGESEGWLTSSPRWHLSADPATTARWQPALAAWAGTDIITRPAPDAQAAAAAAAQRHLGGQQRVNLMPPDFATRYRQSFIDRLWMSGILSAAAIYLVAVLVYFLALQVLQFRKHRVDAKVAALTPSFQKATELKARQEILQEQVRLRFAALDCLRVTSELLPEELTLTSFNFRDGAALTLEGTVPADAQRKITEFNSELKKAQQTGSPLFASVGPPSTILNPGAAAGSDTAMARWKFSADLARSAER